MGKEGKEEGGSMKHAHKLELRFTAIPAYRGGEKLYCYLCLSMREKHICHHKWPDGPDPEGYVSQHGRKLN